MGMSKTAVLGVNILVDSKRSKKELDHFAKLIEKFELDTSKGFGRVIKTMQKVYEPLNRIGNYAGMAAGAWAGLAKKSVDAASEMQQASGAVEAVFKGQADVIKQYADEAAQHVGLSAAEYSNMAALMGAQLENLGISQGDLIPTTKQLIEMGADLASMYGGTTKEAVEALSAAFRGEYDPIERYAMSIRKSDINAGLAAKGLNGLEGEALRTAETQELLALLTEQSSVATGNFAKEADTMAGQQQRANAEWENAKAKLGESLLPIMTEAYDVLGDFAYMVGEQPDLFMAFGIAAVGIFGTLKTLTGLMTIFTTVAAMNPVVAGIIAVVATIAGLVIAFKYAYEHCEGFRAAVDGTVGFAKWGFGVIVDAVKAVINTVKALIDWIKKISWKKALPKMFSFSFGADYAPLKGIMPPESLFKFLPAQALAFAGVPDITAARITYSGLFAPQKQSVDAAPVINVTVNGAIDPIATGKQLEGILNDWAKRKAWRQ